MVSPESVGGSFLGVPPQPTLQTVQTLQTQTLEQALPDRDHLDDLIDQVATIKPELDLSGLAITGRILRLAVRLEGARSRLLDPFDLTVGEFDVLATVRRSGSITAAEICQAVMITAGGMTKRLDRLEGRGLLQRAADPADRRSAHIVLTAKGTQLTDDVYRVIVEVETHLVTAELGGAELRAPVEAALRALLRSPALADPA